AAIRSGRRHGRARETLVLLQRARPVQHPDVIVAVDGHPADRADRPLFGQRLRKRRIVSKLRDLDILLRLSQDDAAASRPPGPAIFLTGTSPDQGLVHIPGSSPLNW